MKVAINSAAKIDAYPFPTEHGVPLEKTLLGQRLAMPCPVTPISFVPMTTRSYTTMTPIAAPTSWAKIINAENQRLVLKFLVPSFTSTPKVTAGLKCPPETGP